MKYVIPDTRDADLTKLSRIYFRHNNIFSKSVINKRYHFYIELPNDNIVFYMCYLLDTQNNNLLERSYDVIETINIKKYYNDRLTTICDRVKDLDTSTKINKNKVLLEKELANKEYSHLLFICEARALVKGRVIKDEYINNFVKIYSDNINIRDTNNTGAYSNYKLDDGNSTRYADFILDVTTPLVKAKPLPFKEETPKYKSIEELIKKVNS